MNQWINSVKPSKTVKNHVDPSEMKENMIK